MITLSTKFVVSAEEAIHINRLEAKEDERIRKAGYEHKRRQVEGARVQRDPLPPDPRWGSLPEVGV